MRGSQSLGLHIRGQPVECNPEGYPLKESFLNLLLPDPAGKGERAKVNKGDKSNLDYIEDLDAYVALVCKKIGTFEDDVRENFSFEENPSPESIKVSESLSVNSQVLKSLALLLETINTEKEPEYAVLIKDTALPFIKALKRQGPMMDANTEVPPETQGDALFGVSQRIDQLEAKIERGHHSVIGKRALELYKQMFPGHTPPQRVIRNEEHGKEYLMNLYTEETARHTLDVAIMEQEQKRKKQKVKK